MRIGRTIPPAAAPIPWKNILKTALFCLSNSTKNAAFEAELKSYFGVKYCFLLSSGKGALTLILQSLHDLSPEKTEVLIPAFTCYSVPASIKNAGLNIKLCDLNTETLDFDRENLHTIITAEKGKLLCVVPTHLFGIPADIPSCREVVPADVAIIEDAAQAMGNEWQGRKLGTIGDVGFFSLGRGKALSAIEGGIIVTDRDDIGEALKKRFALLPEYTAGEKLKLLIKSILTNFFLPPALFWFPKSLPFLHLGETIYEPNFTIQKLSSLHALLAQNWESRLLRYQNIRKTNTTSFLSFGQNTPKTVLFPWRTPKDSLIRLPALATSKKRRDDVISSAAQLGKGIMPPYPSPINEIPDLIDEFHNLDFPKAKLLSDRMLTIPTHNYMQQKDYQHIHNLLLKME